jgi:F-type H+-transporting ATPase subunit epsilon
MPLHVELVSPEQVLFQGDADFVVARTIDGGDIGFQPGHAAFLGALADWPVRVIAVDGTEHKFAAHGGFVQVDHDRCTILSDVAELSQSIDVARAREARARAEEALRTNPDDPEAVAALARANTRLDVAGVA